MAESQRPEKQRSHYLLLSPSVYLSPSQQKVPAVMSPRKAGGREMSPVRSSPGKPKVQLIENLQKPPLVPRDGLGQFASSQQFLRIMDSCRSAYTNYQVRFALESRLCECGGCLQVSLAAVGEDRFSRLLQSTHNMATILLEVPIPPLSLPLSHVPVTPGCPGTRCGETCRRTDELFLRHVPSGSFGSPTVCPAGLAAVESALSHNSPLQLLNALFGMNVAAQHSAVHSPYLSSLPFELNSHLK